GHLALQGILERRRRRRLELRAGHDGVGRRGCVRRDRGRDAGDDLLLELQHVARERNRVLRGAWGQCDRAAAVSDPAYIDGLRISGHTAQRELAAVRGKRSECRSWNCDGGGRNRLVIGAVNNSSRDGLRPLRRRTSHKSERERYGRQHRRAYTQVSSNFFLGTTGANYRWVEQRTSETDRDPP